MEKGRKVRGVRTRRDEHTHWQTEGTGTKYIEMREETDATGINSPYSVLLTELCPEP